MLTWPDNAGKSVFEDLELNSETFPGKDVPGSPISAPYLNCCSVKSFIYSSPSHFVLEKFDKLLTV